MMVDIWREKVERLQVYDTWNLHQTVMQNGVSLGGSRYDHVRITHSFAEYGVYQDMGVGKGFRRGNGGDLGFTPLREARPWLSPKFFASVMNLKEDMAHLYGEEFCGILFDVLQNKK